MGPQILKACVGVLPLKITKIFIDYELIINPADKYLYPNTLQNKILERLNLINLHLTNRLLGVTDTILSSS